MKELSVSKFKSQSAHHLREVKAGESIIITTHGKPVAQVRPFVSDQSNNIIAWMPKKSFHLPEGSPPPDFTGSVMGLVNEDRADARP